jgi:hypothetical protein
VKGGGSGKPLTAELDNYNVIEDIAECYHLSVTNGMETLTKLDIAWYNSDTEEWENI